MYTLSISKKDLKKQSKLLSKCIDTCGNSESAELLTGLCCFIEELEFMETGSETLVKMVK